MPPSPTDLLQVGYKSEFQLSAAKRRPSSMIKLTVCKINSVRAAQERQSFLFPTDVWDKLFPDERHAEPYSGQFRSKGQKKSSQWICPNRTRTQSELQQRWLENFFRTVAGGGGGGLLLPFEKMLNVLPSLNVLKDICHSLNSMSLTGYCLVWLFPPIQISPKKRKEKKSSP